MKICGSFELTIYCRIFIFFEFISIIILFIFYLNKTINLCKYPNNSYDKIDLILIYLSEIQLVFFFLRLCQNYNIFTVLISINKFSQNLMICALIMIIILGKFSNSKTKIINYFLITLLIADILLFLININDNESFKKSDTESLSNLVVAILCVILNTIIAYKSYFFKNETNNKINDDFYKNKLISLNKIDSGNANDNENNENEFFNTIFNQHLSNAITILSVYFNILIPFLISYFIEIILYFFFNTNNNGNKKEKKEDIINNNNTTYIDENNTLINLIFTNNSIYKLENLNKYNNSCIFLENAKNTFNFEKLIICSIFYILRDFLPYFMTYLMFFYYKLKYHRKLSF